MQIIEYVIKKSNVVAKRTNSVLLTKVMYLIKNTFQNLIFRKEITLDRVIFQSQNFDCLTRLDLEDYNDYYGLVEFEVSKSHLPIPQ